jgi:hypothetical protein
MEKVHFFSLQVGLAVVNGSILHDNKFRNFLLLNASIQLKPLIFSGSF